MNSAESCRGNCASYQMAETGDRCFKKKFCAKQSRCSRGRLFDCTFFDADAWVCMSERSGRRYDWVEYEDGVALGQKGQCRSRITKALNIFFTNKIITFIIKLPHRFFLSR
jgi:hypothetical protein